MGRALVLDGIGVLSPLPAPRGASRKSCAIADGARGPRQNAWIAAVAVLLDRGEQNVLHQIFGFVRSLRTARGTCIDVSIVAAESSRVAIQTPPLQSTFR
jgi:hypothetical protein